MASQSTVTFDGVMKERYEGELNTQFNTKNIFLSRLKKGSEPIQGSALPGKYVKLALKVARNKQVGGRAEGAFLPGPGRTKNISAEVRLKRIYGNAGVTDFSEVTTASEAQAWVSTTKDAIDGLKEAIQHDLARMIYNREAGDIAQITAVDDTDDPSFVVTLADNRHTYARNVEVGQLVQTGTVTDGVATLTSSTTGFEITAVDVDAGTATLLRTAGAGEPAEDEFLFQGSPSEGSSSNEELNGLRSFISDTEALHGVTPGVTPDADGWAAVIDDNGGTPRSLSVDLMHQTINKIASLSGTKPNLAITSLGLERAAHNLLESRRQIMTANDFEAGRGFFINMGDGEKLELVADYAAPRGEINYVNTDKLYKWQDSDFRFSKFGGGIQHRYERKDQFELIMKSYLNYGTKQRNAHGATRDLTDASAF